MTDGTIQEGRDSPAIPAFNTPQPRSITAAVLNDTTENEAYEVNHKIQKMCMHLWEMYRLTIARGLLRIR